MPPAPVSPAAPLTRAIVAANVLVFVAQVVAAKSSAAIVAVPPDVMLAFGANWTPATFAAHREETLLTSCFLHFSIVHIAFNMYALWDVGALVERSVGPSRFAPMYVISGIIGSFASVLVGWATHAPRLSAGASGAICGVIGAALVIGIRTQGVRGPVAQATARWLASVLVFGFVFHFDNAAHAGGAIGGALIAAAWRRGVTHGPVRRFVSIGGAALVCLLAFAIVAVHDFSAAPPSFDAR